MKAQMLWLFTVINLILLVSSASAHDSAVGASAPLAAPVGTAFTYQGRLRSNTKPFTGSCDFQFSLWDTLSGGARIGGVLSTFSTLVSDGRFTVSLDFGAAFDGNGRWLQVAVRCPAGSGGFTTLTPRQALAPSPYAVRATTASSVPWTGITGKPAGFADDVDNTVTVPLKLSGSSVDSILTAQNNGQSNPNNSQYAVAVLGISPAGRGLEGQSTSGFGVAGFSTNTSGVFGRSTTSDGVAGQSDGADATGVLGTALGANGNGLMGIANNGMTAAGVWGRSTSGFAGYFSGAVQVDGNFSVANGTKNFIMDHPLDPANKYLRHASVESPDMKNIYDGVVTLDAKGAATVALPAWFEALNQDFRYQLTAIGAPGPNLYIAQEIQGNRFAIAGGQPGTKVSWQVTGIRHDAWAAQHPMQVEEIKPPEARGKYLYPQGFGQPASKSEDYAKQQAIAPQLQTQSQSKAP